ncbi:hypothetical protein Tco_1420119 [Tanacetum coccineum]
MDSMVWRHPNAAIDVLRPAAGSFSMDDVRRLSPHVIMLRDMPEGVLVLSGLSHVWKSRVCDLVVWGVNGNVMGIHDFLCLPELTGAKASTSSATSSHIAKRTRFALAHSYSSTTHPTLFMDHSDDGSDDDACVEILLVTLIHFAAVIPSSGNQGRSFAAPAAKGPGTRVRWCEPTETILQTPSFRDVSGDAIHTDFFPFSAGPYYSTYPEGGVAGNYEFTREEWDAPYRPTFTILTKEVFKDPTICKIMEDQLPTPGEMV